MRLPVNSASLPGGPPPHLLLPAHSSEHSPASPPAHPPLPGFYIHNLGCKLNRVEADTMSAALQALGARAVTQDEAQLVLVNSCTVTAEADTKTRKALRQALAARCRPQVILTGCAVVLEQAAYDTLDERLIVVSDRQKAVEKARALLALKPSRSSSLPPGSEALRLGAGFPTRMGLKIQDGCDGRCSYCIVHQVRGAPRFEPSDRLLAQAQEAERAEVRELVLTGVNIGLYDEGGKGLVGLLVSLLEATRTLRLRLSSLEPQYLTEELLRFVAASGGRICAHLHLPLQSGSDRVLEQMGRRYRSAWYRKQVERARELLPHLGLTTDVICGFPGETEEDHAESREFCLQMRFMGMHVFRFSARAHTPAAERSDQLAAPLIARRAREMRLLAQRMARVDAERRIGTSEQVLVEGVGQGRSESYHRVSVPASLEPGSLLPMRFVACRDTLIQALPLNIPEHAEP